MVLMKEYTYEKAGVSVQKAHALSDMLFSGLKSSNFKDFAGVFRHPALPGFLFAGTTDGIGTKAIALAERGLYAAMAQDLVAMNLNDLICTGAKPLFFLDYIAVNRLEPVWLSKFIKELDVILKRYNCAFLGGETSETPDIIREGLFDTAGFMAGLVKEEDFINGNSICKGDVVIALKSSGAHSNGFSLIRKLYADKKIDENIFLKSLAPTVIYADCVLKMCSMKLVKGLANVTGGGILENVARAVPDGLCAVLNRSKLPIYEVFDAIGEFTDREEMFRIFNMGAGFCLITGSENVDRVLEIAKTYEPFVFGTIEEGKNGTKARFED